MALSKRPEREEPITKAILKPVIAQESTVWRLSSLLPIRQTLSDLRLDKLEREINFELLRSHDLKIPPVIARMIIDTGEMLSTQLPPKTGIETYRRLYDSSLYLLDLEGEVSTRYQRPAVALGELNKRAWRLVLAVQEKGLKGSDGTREIPGIRDFIIKLAASENLGFRKGAKEED